MATLTPLTPKQAMESRLLLRAAFLTKGGTIVNTATASRELQNEGYKVADIDKAITKLKDVQKKRRILQ